MGPLTRVPSTASLARRDAVSLLPVGARFLAAAVIASLVAELWTVPESRGVLLLLVAVLCWILDVVPDYVVALGLVAAWNVARVGPSAASLSGFASPVWFLVLGLLAVGGGLARSGVLQRLAFALLSVFPATFVGQSVAFLVGGVVLTPLLPLTVARCALTAPLARQVVETLGYRARSRAAVGIGLAAFTGSGLLSRVFMSGATLNLIAWSLLPVAARPGWWTWLVASTPMLLVLGTGTLAILLLTCRPEKDRGVSRDAIRRARQAMTPLTLDGYVAGLAAAVVLVGLVAGPYLAIDGAWFAILGAMLLAANGVLTREQFRATIDWPLLVFLGVILGMPAMIHHVGLDADVTRTLPGLVLWTNGSPAWTVTLLFLVVTMTRVVLSEWVAIPLLTAALVPIAPAVGLHPWIVAFVVLSAANLWSLPYQFASYLAFWSASDGELFAHEQVRTFSVAYVLLSLGGLLVSIPLWRWLGFVG